MLGLGGEKDNKGPPKHKNIYRIYVMYKLPALGIYYKLLVLVKKWTKVIYRQFEIQCLLVREYVEKEKEKKKQKTNNSNQNKTKKM